jgi:PAS domain S-box-containing protein
MEKALRDSENKFATIIEFLPDATFVIDMEGKVVAWNRAMEEMTGVSKDDMIGQGDHAYTVPFYGERRQQLLDLLDKDDREIASKYQYVQRKDNTLYAETFAPALHGGKGAYVWATGGPIFDAHGNRVGAIESIRDITELQASRDELRWNAALLAAQVESSLDGILVVDGQGKRIITNQRLLTMWNVPQSIIDQENDAALLEYVISRVKNPDQFREKVTYLYRHLDETSRDEIEFNDGLVMDRYSSPVIGRDGKVYGRIWTFRDISDRKKAEDALRESEQRLANIIDFLPDATFAVNLDGKVIAWNRAVEEMTDIAKDRILDRGSYAYAIPFYGKTRPILIDLVIQNQKEIESEYSNIIRKGDQIIAEASTPMLNKGKGAYLWCIASPLYDSRGSIVGAIESLRDITEHKLAVDALKASEIRYRQIVDTANEGILAVDKDFIITFVNAKMADLLGYDHDEMIGCSVHDFMFEEDLPDHQKRREVRTQGVSEQYERRFRQKDGTGIWAWVSASPLRDSQNRFVGSFAMLTDISGRKKTERALKESERRLKDIISFLPDATFVIDKDGMVTYWNRAIEAMTGVKAEDILGKGNRVYSLPFYGNNRPILIDLALKNDKKFEETYERIERKGDVLVGEAYMTNMNVGEVYLWGNASSLHDSEGNIVGAIESIRDITDKKQTEMALRRSRDELEMRVKERTDELVRKNTEMERFIYTVSHDLRTPLVSMSGFLGFIEQDAQKGDLDRLKDDLRIVGESVSKMDRLLLGTLELSRVGRVINPPEDVSFDQIVQDALEQVAERIRSGNVKVTVAQNMPKVHVDMLRIVEVLVNLIENSVKYMGDQEGPKIEIGSRKNGDETVFFVKDNGIGIDPKEHEKVFGLFYKVDRKSEGAGAGLSIVKRIIEVHGGRIWIESELGRGCTICFTLPPPANVG